MKLFLFMTIATYSLIAEGYYTKTLPITDNIKKRMIKGNSWKEEYRNIGVR